MQSANAFIRMLELRLARQRAALEDTERALAQAREMEAFVQKKLEASKPK